MHYEVTPSLPILFSRAIGAVLLGRDSEPKLRNS